MKNISEVNQESLMYQLYIRVKGGEHRTINEWANEFNVIPRSIAGALSRLRKMNIHMHPVGTVTGFTGESKSGVVVDIMTNSEYFTEVYNRAVKTRVNPSIRDILAKSETAYSIFPKFARFLEFNLKYFISRLSGKGSDGDYTTLSDDENNGK